MLLQRLRTALDHPRSQRRILIAALVLSLPSITNDLVLDDHVLRMLSRDEVPIAGLQHGRPGLFTFTTGEPALNRALMDEGALLPWWSDPAHLNAFLRPLSSASHRIDFALFDGHVWVMHLHSLLWFALLLVATARLYRRIGGGAGAAPTVAVLAAAIFALDDAHGATLSWLANRNAIIAAALAVFAIDAHARWRSKGLTGGPAFPIMLFGLALMAGEAAVGALGYVFAYALLLDRAPLGRRLLSLVPYGVLLLAWQLVYRQLGLGSAGSGAYHDPVGEPLAFAAALAQNLPILLAAQLGPPIADLAFWGDPTLIGALWGVAIATLAVLGWVARRTLTDPTARFWALGMCLAAVPVSASLPGERLLLLVGTGGSPLIALALQPLLEGSASGARRAILVLLALAHLVVAPLTLPVRAHSMPILGRVLDRADASLPAEVPTGQRWFILNAPFDVAASYIQVARASRGQPRPQSLNWLATASSEITVVRDTDNSLTVTPQRGFLASPPERHYRGDPAPLIADGGVRLSAVRVQVVGALPDGRPAGARFLFDEPLSDAGYRFFYWDDGVYRPWSVPPVGTSARFEAQDFFRVVLQQ